MTIRITEMVSEDLLTPPFPWHGSTHNQFWDWAYQIILLVDKVCQPLSAKKMDLSAVHVHPLGTNRRRLCRDASQETR